MLVCVFLFPLHTRPRVQRTPGFPCALSVFCEGGEFAKPGRVAPRRCGRTFLRLEVESETRRFVRRRPSNTRHCLRQTRSVCARERSDKAIQLCLSRRRYGLLRGACHRAGVRPTRWLAMTMRIGCVKIESVPETLMHAYRVTPGAGPHQNG